MFLNSLVTKWFVLWSIIICLLVSACNESSTKSTDPSLQKYNDLSKVKTAFVKGIVYRDKEQLRKVTSKPVFEQLNGWFANHPPVECHDKNDYRMSTSGGPTVEEAWESSVIVLDKVRVQISCNQQESDLISFYNLEIYNLEFIYTATGWNFQEWESIREYKGF